MSLTKIAVVTGGNKGIGLEIVKGLAKKFNGVVYLTGLFRFRNFIINWCHSSNYIISKLEMKNLV